MIDVLQSIAALLAIIGAIALFFALIMMFISVAMSLLSGWFSLSRKYAKNDKIDGVEYKSATINMGWLFVFVTNSGGVHITLNENGFGMRTVWLFRLMHPNLYIPWADIEKVKYRRYLFLFHSARIKVKGYTRKMTFYGAVGLYAHEAYLYSTSQNVDTRKH